MTGPWNLPAGWRWTRFDEVATIASNLVSPADYPDHPHLAPNHVVPGSGRYEKLVSVAEDGVTSNKHLFQPGQIIYSKIRPYLRKAVIAKTEGLCSADMYPIETELEPRYLMWWMLSGEFTKLALKGRSVIPKINQRELKALPVPVPPLAEQHAIIEAIERMLSRLDQAAGVLARVSPRTAAARLSLVDKAAVRIGTWATLSEVANLLAGPAFKSQGFDPSGTGVRLLRGANVGHREVDWSPGVVAHWPTAEAHDLDDLALRRDDIVLAIKRPVISTGLKIAKLRAGDAPSLLVQGVARIRCETPELASWVYLMMQRPRFIADVLAQSGQSTGPPYASLTALRSATIPLPTDLAAAITDLEAQLSRLEAAPRSVRAGLASIPALRRSILKAAFEGRLTGSAQRAQPLDALQEAIA